MNIQKIEALCATFQNTKDENERQALAIAIIEEVQAMLKQYANRKADTSHLPKTRVAKAVDLLAIVLAELMKHELATQVIHWLKKVLGL